MPKMIYTNITNNKPISKKIESFKGVDLTSSETTVDLYRSPDCLNLVPDNEGFPVKRNGYRLDNEYQDEIFGGHIYKSASTEKMLIHSGSNLYFEGDVIYEQMNQEKSYSIMLEDKLFISDGAKLLVYGEFETETSTEIDTEQVKSFMIKTAEEIATVPTITIGRAPSGGGTSYNPPNLLTGWVEEHFLADGTATEYQLSYTGLLEDDIIIQQMNADGEFEVVAADDYTVDRTTGVVTFDVAPEISPITGQDNIQIKYKKEYSADKINKAKVQTLFGVNGQPDTLVSSKGQHFFKNFFIFGCFMSKFLEK